MSKKEQKPHMLIHFKDAERKKSTFKKSNALHNKHVHTLRLQFKHLQAYVSFVENITHQEIELPDELLKYYKLIGNFREVQIFDQLCLKYTPHAKAILSINKEQILKTRKQVIHFYKSTHAKQLQEMAHEVIQKLTTLTRSMKEVELLNGVEHFLIDEEAMIKQLLSPTVVTDVSLHEVRKKIKTLMFLLPKAALLEPVTFKYKLKAYEKIAKKIGKRNDLNQLIEYLEKLPRSGKEAELVEKIRHKEQHKKEKIIQQLRTYFHVEPVQLSEMTKRVSETSSTSATSTKKKQKQPAKKPTSRTKPKTGLKTKKISPKKRPSST